MNKMKPCNEHAHEKLEYVLSMLTELQMFGATKSDLAKIYKAVSEAVSHIPVSEPTQPTQAALQAQHQATWAMAIEAVKQKCRDQQERRPENCKWEHQTYAYLERFASDLACPPLETKGEE
jgi:hypothetical protein